MAIDATVGGSASNSYLTVAEADAYFATRLHSSDWTSADEPTKEAALIWATRLVDSSVCFTGSAATSTQALTWPRTGMVSRNGFPVPSNVVPQEIKNVTAETAMLLIRSDRTAENEASAAGLSKLKAGPVELTFSDDIQQLEAVPSSITSSLPASWLCPVIDPDTVRRPTFFAVL